MINDIYPHRICLLCVKRLTDCFLFREECFQTHNKFEQLYQSTSHCNDSKELHQLSKTEKGDDNKSYKDIVEDKLIISENPLSHEDPVNPRTIQHQSDIIYSSSEENYFENTTSIHVTSVNVSSESENETIFPCNHCSKVFKSKYGLNAHVKIHKGSENLKCQICGKQFTRYLLHLSPFISNLNFP